MVDFRRGNYPIELATGIMAQKEGQNPAADIFGGALKGVEVAENISKIIERKKKAKEIADIMKSPEYAEMRKEYGSILDMSFKENPVDTFKTIISYKEKKNLEGIKQHNREKLQKMKNDLYAERLDKMQQMTPQQVSQQREDAKRRLDDFIMTYGGYENVPNDLKEEMLSIQAEYLSWDKMWAEKKQNMKSPDKPAKPSESPKKKKKKYSIEVE